MRRAFTLGIDAKGATTVIAGLSVPALEQRILFGEMRKAGVPSKFENVILATSDGHWKLLNRAKTAAQIKATKLLEAAIAEASQPPKSD